ncbi:acetyl-CoA carboxylase biotin carboxyl carrier protein [Lentibacillus saliphilus]|uniref:acetyl-CoA carboxylase biotin carboxyl carrier protein n=1 Tax=Lentibacillus saliphilus TaxID=2737028 RepID=UPI001C2F42FD|nr:acetyl-CoA carboxylase biotin carboxyl carrier protein [Lentibacillus saliphilus]
MLKVQEIRELIKLIDESSIDEFTYETNGTTVSMKKSTGQQVVNQVSKVEERSLPVAEAQPHVQTTEPATVVSQSDQAQGDTTAQAQSSATDYDYEIVSPMVGTFYEAASPESDPYVQVGSRVEQSTVVCIVEAMKLFNEIEAETNGEIVEILVKNGELVEYGQPLFRVKTK